MDNGYTKAKIYIKLLRRFCLLFFLGWIASGTLFDLNPSNFRLYGNTLQSIAFGYLITALIVLNIKKVSMQLVAGISLVVVYWALLAFASVPGVGRGVLTPDGNFAMYIDRLVLSFFMNPKSQYTWMLSSLAFGGTVISGYFAGLMLKQPISENQKLIRLSLVGIGLIVTGLLLSLHQPIIKKIWSSSMVLYSSGISYLLLALSFLFTDKMKIDSWWTRGLRLFGLNAIAAYILHQSFSLHEIAGYWMHGLEQYTGSFYPVFTALCKFGIIYFILRHLYKHKIFLKV
jgi:predicted acyltransferase